MFKIITTGSPNRHPIDTLTAKGEGMTRYPPGTKFAFVKPTYFWFEQYMARAIVRDQDDVRFRIIGYDYVEQGGDLQMRLVLTPTDPNLPA